MKRALIERSQNITNLPAGYMLTKPDILQSSISFEDSKFSKNPHLKSEDDSNDLNASHTCLLFLFLNKFF